MWWQFWFIPFGGDFTITTFHHHLSIIIITTSATVSLSVKLPFVMLVTFFLQSFQTFNQLLPVFTAAIYNVWHFFPVFQLSDFISLFSCVYKNLWLAQLNGNLRFFNSSSNTNFFLLSSLSTAVRSTASAKRIFDLCVRWTWFEKKTQKRKLSAHFQVQPTRNFNLSFSHHTFTLQRKSFPLQSTTQLIFFQFVATFCSINRNGNKTVMIDNEIWKSINHCNFYFVLPCSCSLNWCWLKTKVKKFYYYSGPCSNCCFKVKVM